MQILPKSKFTWILVLFVAYVYYSEYVDNRKAPKNVNLTVIEAEKGGSTLKKENKPDEKKEDATLSDKIVDKIKKNETGKVVFEALVKKSIEDKYGKDDIKVIAVKQTGALTIIDSLVGNGAALNCGAKAVINYEAFMSSGIKFDATRLKEETYPIEVQLGTGQVIKGLEVGIIGMREGGRRKITIPSELAFDNPRFTNNLLSKGEVVAYDVELVKIKDGPYKTGMAINAIKEVEGTGDKFMCGDKVKIKYNFSKLDGTPIPSAIGDVEFVIGSGAVPIGLEFAATDMKLGGTRTVQIPYELLKSAGKNIFPSTIKFADGETIQADIEVIE